MTTTFSSSLNFRIPTKPPQIQSLADAQSAVNEIYNAFQQVIYALKNINGISVGPYTLATLPPASVSKDILATVSDGAGGIWLVFSNGIHWLYPDGSVAI